MEKLILFPTDVQNISFHILPAKTRSLTILVLLSQMFHSMEFVTADHHHIKKHTVINSLKANVAVV